MNPSNTHISTPVPFPPPAAGQTQQDSQPSNHSPHSPTTPAHRSRTSTNASSSSAAGRIGVASIKLMEADPPPGMRVATGTVAAKAPSLREIRRGSFGTSGWSEEQQKNVAESGVESSGKHEERVRRNSFSQGAPSPESPVRLPLEDRRTTLAGAHAAIGAGTSNQPASEDTRAPAQGNPPREAMQYDGAPKTMDAAAEVDSHESSEAPEKEAEATQGRPQQERLVRKSSEDPRLHANRWTVLEWLRSSTQSSLEDFYSRRPQSLLEVVPHSRRVSDHSLRSQRHCVGRHALPLAMQCCSSNVQADV
jgi:hypothetical protein